jgi:hypothetical protein
MAAIHDMSDMALDGDAALLMLDVAAEQAATDSAAAMKHNFISK